MRTTANIFIIAFVLDSGISAIDEILSKVFGIQVLSPIRLSIAGLVMITAFLLFIYLGINHRLPKKLFLPMIAFVFFGPLSGMPLPLYFSINATGAIITALQILVSIGALLFIKKMTNGKWLLTASSMVGEKYSPVKSFLFFVSSAVIIPILLIAYVSISLSLTVTHSTAGFVRLGPEGLYLQERVYQNQAKTIRLIGMIHVGEKGYYEDLEKSFASANTVILAEGVTDSTHLLKNIPSIDKIADVLGLSSQYDMELNYQEKRREQDSGKEPMDAEVHRPDVIRADIDLKDFSQETIQFLNQIGESINSSDSLIEAILSNFQWAKNNLLSEKQIKEDILTKRNAALMRHLDMVLGRYDIAVIPWGAMHMPEIEKALIEKGFSLTSTRERLGVDFPELLSKLQAQNNS